MGVRQISQPVELSGYEVLRRIDRGDDRRSVLADDASGTRVECLIGSECGQPISDSAPPKWTHPHLVAISDVVAANDAHGPIVVFGHRQGGTLSALVRDNGPLSLGETSTVMRPLIDVTAFLHSRGIGHGRISPENVFISAYGKPALLPPSSARLLDPGSETRRHGLESGRPEGHADLADLGTLAWTLLAGHPPGADRPPIRVLRPDVPDGWVSLIEEPEKISVADAAAIFASPSSGIMPEPLRLSRTDRAEPSSDALTMQLRIAALDEKEPGEPVHRRRHATRLRQRHPRTVLIGSVAAAVAAGVMCAVLAVTVFPRPMRALLLGHDDDSASVARASGPATTRTPGKQRARASPAADPLDAVRALIRIRTSMFQIGRAHV